MAQLLSRVRRRGLTPLAARLAAYRRPDLAVFHEFHRPPYGGGNQFLLALVRELRLRGLRIENNTLSPSSRACLFNSFNFEFDHLRRLRRPSCRMVHRVDGPVDRYRGRDEGVDRRIWALNQELADITVFQSHYSLDAHLEAGLEFRNPRVITNAVDPAYFFPSPHPAWDGARRTKLIATSWSTNPNKGAATYQWLDQHLDWDRYEFTFVGRSAVQFERIRLVSPVPSRQLGQMLRAHDVYVTASLNESCSNALIEALACGLPAVFARSGGNPEIVGEGGIAFDRPDEIPGLLDEMIESYEAYRARVRAPSLGEVADAYLQAMALASPPT